MSNEHINFSTCLCPGLCELRCSDQPAKIASCLAISKFIFLRGECCIFFWNMKILEFEQIYGVNSPALASGKNTVVFVVFIFATDFNGLWEPQT